MPEICDCCGHHLEGVQDYPRIHVVSFNLIKIPETLASKVADRYENTEAELIRLAENSSEQAVEKVKRATVGEQVLSDDGVYVLTKEGIGSNVHYWKAYNLGRPLHRILRMPQVEIYIDRLSKAVGATFQFSRLQLPEILEDFVFDWKEQPKQGSNRASNLHLRGNYLSVFFGSTVMPMVDHDIATLVYQGVLNPVKKPE